MQALILTGGLGTRLRPLTFTTLKPLLPLANVPFLRYPISALRKAGVKDVILCSSDSSAPYKNLISTEKKYGTQLICSKETKRLGTGGALKHAAKHIKASPFFAMNGDSLTDLDFSKMLKFHRSKKSAVTLALIQIEDPSRYGLVLTDSSQRVKKFIEKPSEPNSETQGNTLINGGMYLMEREVLELIPNNTVFSLERDLFPTLIKNNWPVYGYRSPTSNYWLDIGTPEKYLQGNVDVALGRVNDAIPRKDIQRVLKSSKIHKTAFIRKDVIIGKNCIIGENAVLKNCVLLDNVRVGKHAIIENCVVDQGCQIEDFSKVSSAKALGNGTRITSYSVL